MGWWVNESWLWELETVQWTPHVMLFRRGGKGGNSSGSRVLADVKVADI